MSVPLQDRSDGRFQRTDHLFEFALSSLFSPLSGGASPLCQRSPAAVPCGALGDEAGDGEAFLDGFGMVFTGWAAGDEPMHPRADAPLDQFGKRRIVDFAFSRKRRDDRSLDAAKAHP